MSPTTKKLLVSVSFESFKAKSNEFLVPLMGVGETSEFVGIESGKRFPYGALSYIGKAVSATDVLRRMSAGGIDVPNPDAALEVIEKYLERLQEFRMGNVLGISYSPDGDFHLVKVANRPPREK